MSTLRIGPAAAAAEGEEFVTVSVPRAFTVTLADKREVAVPAGMQDLPKSIAEHWYSVANGVTAYVPTKATKATKAPEPPAADPVANGVTASSGTLSLKK